MTARTPRYGEGNCKTVPTALPRHLEKEVHAGPQGWRIQGTRQAVGADRVRLVEDEGGLRADNPTSSRWNRCRSGGRWCGVRSKLRSSETQPRPVGASKHDPGGCAWALLGDGRRSRIAGQGEITRRISLGAGSPVIPPANRGRSQWRSAVTRTATGGSRHVVWTGLTVLHFYVQI